MKYKYFVLDKENNVTIKSTKSFDTIYKTCGYRKSTDFVILHTWDSIEISDKMLSVSLWGKDTGKANNINSSEILENMTKKIYGNVVFVFSYDENMISDIDMSHWCEFKENHVNTPQTPCSESDYTFDEELENVCDSESIENFVDDEAYNNENIDEGLYKNDKIGSKELTYEPYYVSSDDE